MTTDRMTGRALDEAAARAMGWTSLRIERLSRYRSGVTGGGGFSSEPVECLVGNPPDGSSPPPLIRHVNITVDLCMDWLHGRGIVSIASSHKNEKQYAKIYIAAKRAYDEAMASKEKKA